MNYVNEIDEIVAMVTNLKIDMVTKVHVTTATKSDIWSNDLGSTIHVSHGKRLFKNNKKIEGQEVLIDNNAPLLKFLGRGSIELNFSS